MSAAVRLALAGFTPFERHNFESFFRLSARRSPGYELADELARCDLAVADGDDALVMAEVLRLGLLARTLLIGGTPQPGAAAQLPRPINLALVARSLGDVVQRTNARSRSVQRVLDDLATMSGRTGANPVPHGATASASGGDLDMLLSGTPVHAAPVAAQGTSARRGMDQILVVDRSDDTLRFMATHLERFGFQTRLVRNGLQAIESVAQQHFEFVFLEAELADVDGYLTCQAIKRNTYRDQRAPPTVVMLIRGNTDTERLRSILAGSDACLAKPLCEQDLLQVVGAREAHDNAYAETAGGPRTVT